MPKTVCVKCNAEMAINRVGVVVQFNAFASSRPDKAYQQWRADTAKCPDCGTEVVARYADNPTWTPFKTAEPEKPDIIVPERRGGKLAIEPVKPHPSL